MGVTPSDISSTLLLPGLKAIFLEEYEKTEDNAWKQFSMMMDSTGYSETYAFLGATPAMREWLTERIPTGLQANPFTLANKDFEATIEVDRNALKDDRYGEIRAQVQMLAEASRRYYGQMAFTVLGEGDQTTYGSCYDGLEFFDTQHKEGAYYTTVQSNLGSSALSLTAISATRAAMMNFKNDRGLPMGAVPDTIIVSPAYEDLALQLVGSNTTDASGNGTGNFTGLNNPQKGRFQVISSPWITDTDSWIMASCGGIKKPLIFQNRQATEFNALEGNSEKGFMSKKFLYGVDNRFNFGYGDWRTAYMHVP
jgi:phage major head subunit gpT-like protein